jgi:hypothetical protein
MRPLQNVIRGRKLNKKTQHNINIPHQHSTCPINIAWASAPIVLTVEQVVVQESKLQERTCRREEGARGGQRSEVKDQRSKALTSV